MTQKYQNTAFESGKSTFVDVTNQSELVFAARSVSANVAGGRVPMTKGSISVRKQREATPCGEDCPVPVTASVKIEFSDIAGDVDALQALRAEAIRAMDEAIADFGFAAGLVPPSYATFTVL